MFEEEFLLLPLLLLLAAKFLAVTASAVCGGPGGLFGPSFILGAVFGRVFSELLVTLNMKSATSEYKSLIVFGMASFFAGIFRLPITSVVITQELCGASHLTPQLMLVNYMSITVSAKLHEDPLFERLLQQDGVNLKLIHFDIQRERKNQHNLGNHGNLPDSGSTNSFEKYNATCEDGGKHNNTDSQSSKHGNVGSAVSSKTQNPYAHELPPGMTDELRSRLKSRRTQFMQATKIDLDAASEFPKNEESPDRNKLARLKSSSGRWLRRHSDTSERSYCTVEIAKENDDIQAVGHQERVSRDPSHEIGRHDVDTDFELP